MSESDAPKISENGSLDLSRRGLRDLGSLLEVLRDSEEAKTLVKINLDNNRIKDFTPLLDIPSLQTIEVDGDARDVVRICEQISPVFQLTPTIKNLFVFSKIQLPYNQLQLLLNELRSRSRLREQKSVIPKTLKKINMTRINIYDELGAEAEAYICPICLSTPKEKKSDLYKISCGHIYHLKCIEQLKEYHFKECPMCKEEVL